VYFGVLQHPSKFQAKILTGKFVFGNKIKISTRWLSSFQAPFMAITSQAVRLANPKVSVASE